jgi:hypothetical protein
MGWVLEIVNGINRVYYDLRVDSEIEQEGEGGQYVFHISELST